MARFAEEAMGCMVVVAPELNSEMVAKDCPEFEEAGVEKIPASEMLGIVSAVARCVLNIKALPASVNRSFNRGAVAKDSPEVSLASTRTGINLSFVDHQIAPPAKRIRLAAIAMIELRLPLRGEGIGRVRSSITAVKIRAERSGDGAGQGSFLRPTNIR